MPEARQQGGAFGAVLRAVVDNMGQALPQKPAGFPIAPLAGHRSIEILIGQRMQIGPEALRFPGPSAGAARRFP